MGIIRAAATAADSMMEDAWLELFYCDAIPPGTLMVRAKKRTNPNSANYGTPENVITAGSKIIVNEGQVAIVVENGSVIECFQEPGAHIFYGGFEKQGLLKEFAKRVSFGGDNVATQHRLYYLNMRESMNHPFMVHAPVTVESGGAFSTVTYVLRGTYSYSITDPTLFYRKITGNVRQSFTSGQITQSLDSEIIDAMAQVVAKLAAGGVDVLELPAHTGQLCAAVREQMKNGWAARQGIAVTSLLLPSVTVESQDMARYQKREDLTWVSGRDTTKPAPVSRETPPAKLTPSDHSLGIKWRCSCGNVCDRKFCTECGKPKPVPWTCSCGAVNQGKFCENCGKPKPAPWTCSCGAVNKGKFCVNCGKPRTQGS